MREHLRNGDLALAAQASEALAAESEPSQADHCLQDAIKFDRKAKQPLQSFELLQRHPQLQQTMPAQVGSLGRRHLALASKASQRHVHTRAAHCTALDCTALHCIHALVCTAQCSMLCSRGWQGAAPPDAAHHRQQSKTHCSNPQHSLGSSTHKGIWPHAGHCLLGLQSAQ